MNNKYSLPKDGGLIAESAPRDIIHRYEKIHTRVYENEYNGVLYVADTIVKAIRTYNEIHSSNEVYEEAQPFVLGLTTGRTPLGLYRELVKRHKEGQISFRNVAVYSLDEFYPIKSTEQQSRNFRIHEEFLNHIDIQPENVHIPDGTVQAAIGDSIGLYITAKNGKLTAIKGFADKPTARLVFKDLKTAQGVLSGKTDTYAAIAVGDLVMKGFIPMIEHMNPILESVSGYLS